MSLLDQLKIFVSQELEHLEGYQKLNEAQKIEVTFTVLEELDNMGSKGLVKLFFSGKARANFKERIKEALKKYSNSHDD